MSPRIYWKDSSGNSHVVKVLRVHSGLLLQNLDASLIEIEPPGQLANSDNFVVMFLGFLATRGLCKERVMPSKLLDCWAEFKKIMRKGP